MVYLLIMNAPKLKLKKHYWISETRINEKGPDIVFFLETKIRHGLIGTGRELATYCYLATLVDYIKYILVKIG